MFYDALKGDHGLPHDPFKALVSPRPIAWVSTLGATGVANLAPYSAYNMVSNNPHMVMFSGAMSQHSTANAIETGEFAINVVPQHLGESMNLTSKPVGPEVDEFELAGLEKMPCQMIKAPRVAASPVTLECTFHHATTLPALAVGGRPSVVVFGLVVGIHMDEALITDEGRVDMTRVAPLARAGYFDYSIFDEAFEMKRPC